MAEKTTFIKVDRNFMNWRWYENGNTVRVFLHLILSANITDHDFENVTVHRGEFVSSYAHLAQKLGISIQGVRTAISHLKSTGEVTTTSYPHFTVFTVVCYDKYQGSQQGKQQKVNNQPTGHQQGANNNQRSIESKNGKEEDAPPAASKYELDPYGYMTEGGYDPH